MNLIITGGAGFLGYNLCNMLSDKFEKIFILDIAGVNSKDYPANAEYLKIDVRRPQQLDDIFKRADVVVHAAAALPLWKRVDIFDINAGGTKNVLEAAGNNGIERVIHISTTAVFGIEQGPVCEDSPLVGIGDYGKSKITAEKICEDYRKKGMCVTILRPKTFIGAGRLGVFYILYDWVASGKKIPIIGDGKNRYQLLDVEDLVEAIYLLVTASAEKVNDTFNIGAEVFGTVKEDLSALCGYAGTGARVLPTPARPVKCLLALFDKLGVLPLYKWIYDTADRNSYVSIEKIKGRLDWSPRYSNSQALIRSYSWYVEHMDDLSETGVTHRSMWKQGVLRGIKKFL